MTPTEFAARLNGRNYMKEITPAEAAEADDLGFVVVFGYSDDNVEFRGVIHDEVGAYGGTTMRVTSMGIMPSWSLLDHDDEDACEAYFKQKHGPGFNIRANFDDAGYTWTFTTEHPHAPFDVMEDGEKFCRGIVFRMIGGV